MNIFKKFKTTVQNSKEMMSKILEDYISFNSEAKQVTLRKKAVLLLCQQAISKVEQIKNLQPHSQQGLIATIQQKNVDIKVHFTPEKIILKEEIIEGQLRLLNEPEFQADSLVYRFLLAGWKTFLGGKIPDNKLPEGVKIEGNLIYYSLERHQLKLLDILFSHLENGSVLITNLEKEELTITSSVTLSGQEIKLENLLQLFK